MDLNGTFGTFIPRPRTSFSEYLSRFELNGSSEVICEKCKANDFAKFKMRVQFGEKDSLSNLPVDCLLSILSYLDRDSLDTVESVSQKIYHVANHKGFRRPNHQYDELTITPNSAGFVLYLNSRRDENHYLVYEYINRKIFKIEVAGKFDYWTQKYTKMVNPEAVYLELFRAMHYICDNYTFFGLTITNMHLDETLLRGLLCALDGYIPDITMDAVTVDEQLSLPDFLLVSKTTMFSMFEVESREQTLFDEKFVRQYSIEDAKTRHLCVTPKSGLMNVWTPSLDFLPIMCRFRLLEMVTIVLTEDMFKRAILMGLEMMEPGSRWQFRVDVDLDESVFDSINNGEISVIEEEPENELSVRGVNKQFAILKGNRINGREIFGCRVVEDKDFDVSIDFKYF